MHHRHTRPELVAGLRALADFLQQHPEISVPRAIDVRHFAHTATDAEMRAEVDDIAALLGTQTEEDSGHYMTSIRFGPVEYRAVAILAASRARHAAARNAHDTAYESATTHTDPAPRPEGITAMKLRLDGTRPEITYSMYRLREIFTVTSVSRAYPNRHRPRQYHIYVNIIPREIDGAR